MKYGFYGLNIFMCKAAISETKATSNFILNDYSVLYVFWMISASVSVISVDLRLRPVANFIYIWLRREVKS